MDSSSEEYRISRRPTGDQSSGGWSLVRAKAKGALKVVSLADDFFGLEVHYWSGRTTPCRAMGCPACEAGLLSRWAGYLPCVQLPKWNLVIVEFTAAACADLDGHRESLKQLRGVNLVFIRPTEKANGRVRVEEYGLFREPGRLPAAPAVWPILAKIFRVNPGLFIQLPTEDEEETVVNKDEPSTSVNGSPVPERKTWEPPTRDLEGQRFIPFVESQNGK